MTLIPGDGIGPELLNHVREVFRLVKLNPVQCVDYRPASIASTCVFFVSTLQVQLCPGGL